MTWLGVTAILAGGLCAVWIYRSLRQIPGDVVATGRQVLAELGEVASAFHSGTVTTRFISHATEVSGSNYLQFAQLTETEIFQRTDEATVLWGNLDLPDLVVEATAPVEYTYFLDLNAPWQLRQKGAVIEVLAPAIEANTPAVDISALTYSVRTGSLLRDEASALARLRAGITEMAKQRADDNVDLVRELGRRKTEEFVENWLARSFADGDQFHAKVVFIDEFGGDEAMEDLGDDEKRFSLPPGPGG